MCDVCVDTITLPWSTGIGTTISGGHLKEEEVSEVMNILSYRYGASSVKRYDYEKYFLADAFELRNPAPLKEN